MSAILKKRIPKLIAVLLVVGLAISLAKLVWTVVTPKAEAAAVKKANASSSATQKKVNYGKLIADQHIFGEAAKASTGPKTPQPEPPKPKVRLNATLHGIVAYRSQKGFALISNKNGPQKVYGENDALQEGVTISKVLATKVLVDNNGTEEELLLPVKKVSSSKSSKQDLSSLPGGANDRPEKKPANTASSSSSASKGAPDLGSVRQEVLADPAKLTDIVRASPAIVNGKFTGFRVRAGKNRKLFRELDFRANDIITSVNGITLDTQAKGLQVMAELETATDLSISVKRGTQEVFINHSF